MVQMKEVSASRVAPEDCSQSGHVKSNGSGEGQVQSNGARAQHPHIEALQEQTSPADLHSGENALPNRRPSTTSLASGSLLGEEEGGFHVAPKKEPPPSIFVDPEEMKRKVRENLMKPTHDVSLYYHPTGVWREIATNPLFDKITLGVIGINAIWIGVDTDYNKSETLLAADPLFQVMEHSFCTFFCFEWTTRFLSFARKRNCFKDAWFIFDSMLVLTMVLETWLLTTIMLMSGGSSSNGLGNASILRMARLARLSRMARMARLLRAMPELMILIKGIAAATRSVFFTLTLLCILMYIFAIAFTQLTVDTAVGREYFPMVGDAMYTLLVYGTLMDNIALPLNMLGKLHYGYGALFLLFVLLAALTLMNMLIGVLTEVVSAVAATEKETMSVTYVRNKMQEVLKHIDKDGDGTISKAEFVKILENKRATEALHEVDVDMMGLVDFADFIFDEQDRGGEEPTLDFGKFMEVVLQFRGSNNATVKDIVNLRKFVSNGLKAQREDLDSLKCMIAKNASGPKNRRTSQTEDFEKGSRASVMTDSTRASVIDQSRVSVLEGPRTCVHDEPRAPIASLSTSTPASKIRRREEELPSHRPPPAASWPGVQIVPPPPLLTLPLEALPPCPSPAGPPGLPPQLPIEGPASPLARWVLTAPPRADRLEGFPAPPRPPCTEAFAAPAPEELPPLPSFLARPRAGAGAPPAWTCPQGL